MEDSVHYELRWEIPSVKLSVHTKQKISHGYLETWVELNYDLTKLLGYN